MNLKSIAEDFTGRSINAVITEEERKNLCRQGYIIVFEYEGAFYTFGMETGNITATEYGIKFDLNDGSIKAEITLGIKRVDSVAVIINVSVAAEDGKSKVYGIVPYESFILYDGNVPYCIGAVFDAKTLNKDLKNMFDRKAV